MCDVAAVVVAAGAMCCEVIRSPCASGAQHAGVRAVGGADQAAAGVRPLGWTRCMHISQPRVTAVSQVCDQHL